MLRVMTKLGVFEGYDGGEGGEGERGTRRAGQRLRSEGLHSGWVALGKRLSLSGLHTDVLHELDARVRLVGCEDGKEAVG